MDIRYPAYLLALVAIAAGTGHLALAADAAAHSHAGHAAHAAPALAPGERWPTDDALRQGMERVRAAVEPRLPRVHAGKASKADYREIAGTVDAQVAYIVSNCKLPPDADAALHVTIAQMVEGADAMAGRSKAAPRDGAVKLVAALDRYAAEFDHPGWKPLRH